MEIIHKWAMFIHLYVCKNSPRVAFMKQHPRPRILHELQPDSGHILGFVTQTLNESLNYFLMTFQK